MKKVLIVDDHPAMRQGVKTILSGEFSGVEFAEASNASEAMREIKKNIDLIVLDVDMPGRNGLQVLEDLKRDGIKIPVLVYTFHPMEQVAVRAIKSGARGYLSKDATTKEFAEAIHAIFSGRKYITQQVSEQMASYMENPFDMPAHELLSPREYQTLLLIAKGKTISEVAEELSLAVPTVSTFRARILEKMNLRNSAELVKYAVDNKLL